MKSAVESCVGAADHCLGLLADEPELEAKYAETFLSEKEMLSRFFAAIANKEWDEIAEEYAKVVFGRMPSAPRGYVSEVKDICKKVRDGYKKEIAEMGKYLCISET